MNRLSLQYCLSDEWNRSPACLPALALVVFWSFSATSTAQERSEEQEKALAEVVVTGSRLARPLAESPTPLTQVDREQLDLAGTTNIADSLKGVPALGTPASTPLTTNTSAVGVGLNLVNLRNLGASRTLTLVNGRRHVAGRAGTSAVDLNAIPADFVERVDVITGGASAIYGSEAIAGVINIVTSRNFEGTALKARIGQTRESDGENRHLSATFGTRFSQDDGHLMLHASYDDGGEIYSRDRRISSTDAFQNPDGSISLPARSGVTSNGTFTFRTTSGNSVTVTRGSDGEFTAPLTQDNRFDRVVYRKILLPVERHLLASTLRYDITDHLSFSTEASYSATRAEAVSEPVAIGGTIWRLGTSGASQSIFNLPVTNPFIPDEIRNVIDPMQTSIEFLARPIGIGNRVHPVDRSSVRIAAGFDGTMFSDWHWDAYVQYGRMAEDQETHGLVNLARFVEAINAEIGPDGQPRCINPVARATGCAPYNPFGQGAASQAALSYMAAQALYESTITQRVAAVSVSGTPFQLPAGDLLLASGIEYREESSDFNVDPLTEGGLLSFAQFGDTIGEFDVSELFAEIGVPLVSDLGFISLASIDAAVRLSEYSTIGSATSWKVGLAAQFPAGFRLRGTYSEANRAPNIGELFLPQQTSGGRVTDPCAGGGVTSGLSPDAAARRRANCAALNIDPSFVPNQLALESVLGLTGGNPNLKEETADTLTAGLVFAPERFPGISASVDYWQIKVADAVGAISRQLTLNQCVDQPTIDNQFCANVTRHPVNRNISAVDTFIQNLASEEVAGVDLGLNFRFSIGDRSSLRFDVLATHLLDDRLQQFTASTVQDRLEEIGRPEWSGTGRINYVRGPFTVGWETRYIGSVLKDKNVTSAPNVVDSVSYSSLYLRYNFTDSIESNIGVENIFDEEAPIIASPHPLADLSTQTVSGIYDPIGVRFFFGVTMRL